MTVGDALEWAAGALAVAAVVAFGWHPLPLALIVAALFLGYEAQCLAGTEFPRLRRRRAESETVSE